MAIKDGDRVQLVADLALRDYIAINALQGMLASGHQEAIEQLEIQWGGSAARGLAMAAYGFADAMLIVRSSRTTSAGAEADGAAEP